MVIIIFCVLKSGYFLSLIKLRNILITEASENVLGDLFNELITKNYPLWLSFQIRSLSTPEIWY